MNRDKIAVVARRRRFEPPTAGVRAANPASPMVLQAFMQVLANQDQKMDTLARKIDALATRSPHEVTAPSAQPRLESLPKTEADSDTDVDAPVVPQRRINRSKLWNLFD